MLVKLANEKYTIVLDADEAAMLVEDIAELAKRKTRSCYETTWSLADQVNRLWYYEMGCSINEEMERLVKLETGG